MNVTQDLSILHLILNASAVVQAVMALLAGVSFMSWYYIFMKWYTVKQARAKTDDDGIVGVEIEVVIILHVGPPKTEQTIDRITDPEIDRATGKAVRCQLQRGNDLYQRILGGVFVTGSRLLEFVTAPVVAQPHRMRAVIGTQVEIGSRRFMGRAVVTGRQLEGPAITGCGFGSARRGAVGHGATAYRQQRRQQAFAQCPCEQQEISPFSC